MSDDAGPSKPKEPEWVTRLANVAARAPAGHRRHRDSKLGNTGAASEGKRLFLWRCACGWSGGSQELKAIASGVACPKCGSAPRPA